MYSGTGVPGAAVFCIGRTNSQGRMLWKINGRYHVDGFQIDPKIFKKDFNCLKGMEFI